jgi:pSer/pThr/pTyr-binding forkhead associated (FHA) protein
VPRLLIIGDEGDERAIELTERTVQIGRGPGNDIVLPDAHKGVSRTHAELRFRNGRCVLVDLQSQNGTFLNGERIEHAEVPDGAEIGVGSYILRIDHTGSPGGDSTIEPPPSTVGFAASAGDAERTGFHDLSLIRSAPLIDAPENPAPAKTPYAAIAGSVLVVAALAAAAWVFGASRAPDPAEPNLPMPDVASAEPAASGVPAQPSPLPAAPTAEIAAGVPAAATPAPPVTIPTANGRPASTSPAPLVKPDGPPVARKPGETVEAWQIRTAAFQTRYAYSRAALDRGDFAAAAGGFEAILREEPGFLDVPQLLVKARAGLKDVARAVYESGQRLDAAGDWLGALQKYEQAGQIHPEVKGLAESIRGVREKLSVAGEGALVRARRLDESGRWSEALREYEKAVQWLPPGDRKREMAQSRVEQLKKASR